MATHFANKYRFHATLITAAVGVVLGGAFTISPALAADPPVSPMASMFGSVDIQELLTGYTKKASYDTELQQFHQELAGYLSTQSTYGMLDQDDQDELGTLLAVAAPTDAQTAEITALEQKSMQASQQLASLQQNQNLTADQTTQMNQLLAEQTAGKSALDGEATKYQGLEQDKSNGLSQQMSEDVKGAIAKVAKADGLVVVFDSDDALYTENDITDAVLKVLNK